jgi:hypothetical protein
VTFLTFTIDIIYAWLGLLRGVIIVLSIRCFALYNPRSIAIHTQTELGPRGGQLSFPRYIYYAASVWVVDCFNTAFNFYKCIGYGLM